MEPGNDLREEVSNSGKFRCILTVIAGLRITDLEKKSTHLKPSQPRLIKITQGNLTKHFLTDCTLL